MSFLAPLFALGIGAVTLPILLHLIRRTPRGRHEFSSLMFLSPSPPRLTRRSRLDNLLLPGLLSLFYPEVDDPPRLAVIPIEQRHDERQQQDEEQRRVRIDGAVESVHDGDVARRDDGVDDGHPRDAGNRRVRELAVLDVPYVATLRPATVAAPSAAASKSYTVAASSSILLTQYRQQCGGAGRRPFVLLLLRSDVRGTVTLVRDACN